MAMPRPGFCAGSIPIGSTIEIGPVSADQPTATSGPCRKTVTRCPVGPSARTADRSTPSAGSTGTTPRASSAFTPTRPGSCTRISTVFLTHPPTSIEATTATARRKRVMASPAAVPPGLQVALDARPFVVGESAVVDERLGQPPVQAAAVGVEAAPHDVAEPRDGGGYLGVAYGEGGAVESKLDGGVG